MAWVEELVVGFGSVRLLVDGESDCVNATSKYRGLSIAAASAPPVSRDDVIWGGAEPGWALGGVKVPRLVIGLAR